MTPTLKFLKERNKGSEIRRFSFSIVKEFTDKFATHKCPKLTPENILNVQIIYIIRSKIDR